MNLNSPVAKSDAVPGAVVERNPVKTEPTPDSEVPMEDLPRRTLSYCPECRRIYLRAAPVSGQCEKCSLALVKTSYRYGLNDAGFALVGFAVVSVALGLALLPPSHARVYFAYPLIGVMCGYSMLFVTMSLGIVEGGLLGRIVRTSGGAQPGGSSLGMGMAAAMSRIFARQRYEPHIPWLPHSFGGRLVAEVGTLLWAAVAVALLAGSSYLIKLCQGDH